MQARQACLGSPLVQGPASQPGRVFAVDLRGRLTAGNLDQRADEISELGSGRFLQAWTIDDKTWQDSSTHVNSELPVVNQNDVQSCHVIRDLAGMAGQLSKQPAPTGAWGALA